MSHSEFLNARSSFSLQKNWCCAATPSLHNTNFFARIFSFLNFAET